MVVPNGRPRNENLKVTTRIGVFSCAGCQMVYLATMLSADVKEMVWGHVTAESAQMNHSIGVAALAITAVRIFDRCVSVTG